MHQRSAKKAKIVHIGLLKNLVINQRTTKAAMFELERHNAEIKLIEDRVKYVQQRIKEQKEAFGRGKAAIAERERELLGLREQLRRLEASREGFEASESLPSNGLKNIGETGLAKYLEIKAQVRASTGPQHAQIDALQKSMRA